MTALRIAWRVGRIELAMVLASGIVLASGSVLWALVLNSANPGCIDVGSGTGCFDRAFLGLASYSAGFELANRLYPGLAGALLGVIVVGREIEVGTAQFSWSVALSRPRWLIERGVATALPFLGVLVILSVTSVVIWSAAHPGVRADASLPGFGTRGPSVVARGIASYCMAILIGAALARVLPAFLAAAFVALPIALLGLGLATVGITPEALDVLSPPRVVGEPLVLDERYRAPDGSLVSWEDAVALAPQGVSADEWAYQRSVAVGIPGTRYPEVALRELAWMAGLSAASAAGAMWLVSRRRPH